MEGPRKRRLTTLLLHKPYGVLSQFTPEPGSRWGCLADLVRVPEVYAAGRLDADSEGLLLLTNQGRLQQRLTNPRFGHWRSYWIQVEGSVTQDQLQSLRTGVIVQGKTTRPAKARSLTWANTPPLPERDPPIRYRANIPTSWLELQLCEGRNRQARRMTAAVGLPTLRLMRRSIDLMDGQPPLNLDGLAPGEWREVNAAEQKRLLRLINSRRRQPGEARRRG